jgi:hypothetical protein
MAALIGSEPFQNRVWNPGTRISGMNSPAEEWVVDPNLVPLGSDPRYPSTDQIVIPKGRLLAVRPDTSSYTGQAVLTIFDGVTNKPAGYTEHDLYRQWPEKIQWMPSMSRQEFMEMPYVQSINAAYGTPAAGDKITGYYGTATGINPVPNDRGKIVKWVEKRVYFVAAPVASAIISLLPANYSGFTPRIVVAYNGSTPATGAVSTNYDTTAGNWMATFSTAVTSIIFEWGQSADKIAGEVIRIEPISSAHHLSGWLEWVTDNFLAWEYPPQLLRVPTTAVVNEVPTVIVPGQWYRLANKPIAPWIPATVTVTGQQVAPDGTVTILNNSNMSQSDMPFVDYTMGQYYNLNPVTGDLYFSSNVTVTSVTVSYSYETQYRYGRLFNPGVIGLTDGRYSGVPGTPANLEIAGVVGSLRCIIY